MGDPSNVAQVTVTATYRLRAADGTTIPATGFVTFTPTTRLQDGGSSEILPVAPVRAVLDATGHISVTLMATDDPDLAPSGWGYQVTTTVGGTSDSFFATFPAAVPTVDLSTVAPASVTPLLSYVALSAVGAPTGVASLDVTGNVPLSQLGNSPGGGGTPSGTVSGSAVGDAGAPGASANYSRGDHVHARESYGSPAASAVGDTQSAGVASTDARSDHRHARESFGAVVAQTAYGAASTSGVATTDARSDHAHGTVALTALTPSASAEADTGAVGTGTAPAREDHRHARESFGGAPGTTEGIGQAGAAGVATTPSRSDHVHPMAAAGAPVASAIGDTQATGVATTFAASDHRHAREALGGVPAASAVGDSGAAGTGTTNARVDHVHAREGFGGAPATTEGIGTAAAAGVATTDARSDHVHPMAAAGAPGASAVGDTQSTGVATTFAASDHRHARESFGGVPPESRTVGTAGVATTDARSDHQHPSSGWAAADLGYLGWSQDPAMFGSSTPLSVVAGTVQLIKIVLPTAQTISTITMQVQTAGGTLTAGQCFAALYDGAGNLKQTTVDQSGAWNSGGIKNMAITATAMAAGACYVAWFYNGTTAPRFLANTSGTAGVNGALSVANSRYATADAGRTTTMPATLGALAASGQSVFAAIS